MELLGIEYLSQESELRIRTIRDYIYFRDPCVDTFVFHVGEKIKFERQLEEKISEKKILDKIL